MDFTKTKYTDNKLAEEFDLIVLINGEHEHIGLPLGALGTLTASYERSDLPLYAQFQKEDGEYLETPISLGDFRVLNVKNPFDLSLVTKYLQQTQSHSPTLV